MSEDGYKILVRWGSEPAEAPPGTKVVGPDWVARADLLCWLWDEMHVPASLDGDRIDVGFGGLNCRVSLDGDYRPGVPVVGLVFDFELPDDGRVMAECLAALANDPRLSVYRSVQYLGMGTLPVLRHMFDPDAPAEGVQTGSIYSLVGSEYTEWEWYAGPPLILYAKPDLRSRLEVFLAEQDLVGRLWDELVGSSQEPGIHWWKCFVTRQQNGEFLGEVAIDNVPQPALFEHLKALPYPESGLFMIRQFSALRPSLPPR